MLAAAAAPMRRPSSPAVVGALLASATSIGRAASSVSAETPAAECLAGSATLPEERQVYRVVNNTRVSPDSNILRVGIQGRNHLGWDDRTPTCISVYSEFSKAKSYSPITHPGERGTFELLVKSYHMQPGGGVGAYLCSLNAGDTFEAKVKSKRVVHSSSDIVGRWSQVGLVAGGTGIAPLYQLLQILLRDDTSVISVLSINRREEDILLKTEMDELARKHPNRLRVTYSLTGEDKPGYERGRGNVEMALRALPKPSLEEVMVFVCGKDGFVESYGGRVEREKTSDGSKGKKIQGPLLGILKDAGFDASQVFKY